MAFTAALFVLAVALFLAMLLLQEVGRRLALRKLKRDPTSTRPGVASIEGAVFALLGLLLAFSFSGAATRFERRSELITAESNAIGTAWLRLDLLPNDARPNARESMKRYVDARLAVYQALPDLAAARAALATVATQQDELWRTVMAARHDTQQGWELLVLPALNEMFDIATERTQAMQRHPPTIVFVLLFAFSLACALLAGFGMSGSDRRPVAHMLAFAAVVSVTVYVIFEIEYPRQGLIRVDDADRVLVELRASMR